MPETDVMTVAPAVVGKMLLARLDSGSVEALRAAIAEDVREHVHEAAVQQAREELEEEFSRRREKLLDDVAKVKVSLEDEMLGELERREEALRQELTDAGEERYLTIRDQRDEARGERDRAEAVLLSIVRQLLPGERPVYLYSAGVREIDRGLLNETLARHGLQVRSKATFSERLVTVRIDQGRVVAHTQFWLTATTPAGVTDEDDSAEAGEA